MSPPAMFLTAQPSILCTMNYARTTPNTKRWWQTAPTKRLGYANAFLRAAAFFPPAIPAPKTKEKGHPWWAYVYDEYFDDVICPEYHALHDSTTNRDGYREYKSRAYLCKTCPTRGMCTESAKCEKTFLRHIWQEYVKWRRISGTWRCTESYTVCEKRRLSVCFADAKEKHGMRYTQYRGLAQVTNWVKLKFAAMNLKKLATWKWNCRHPAPDGGKRTRLGKKYSC